MHQLLRYGDPEEVGMSARRVRGVDDLARRWVEDGTHPALVVLVARRGVVVLHEAHGRLGPEPDDPPLPVDAIFPLGSIAKPFTAACAICLVEDGLLGLNRPVQEYVPEFVGPGKEAVMVHHLLTHTSGLRDEDVDAHAAAAPPARDAAPAPGQHPWLANYLGRRLDAPLWKAPGVEMSYSSFGYTLLGDVVRRVAGQPLPDFARERIFGPLGMRETSYGVPEASRSRIVRRPPGVEGTGPIGSFPAFLSPERLAGAWGSGAAYGTALDVATFAQAMLAGGAGVLSPASVREMTRNQIPGIAAQFGPQLFPEASYGFGWDIRGDKSVPLYGGLLSARAFGHPGAGGTLLYVDPARDLVMLYFSVVLGRDPNGLPIWNVDLLQDATIAAVEEGVSRC
jgi:CubicO group peptidase (beta-lactamase class C family)